MHHSHNFISRLVVVVQSYGHHSSRYHDIEKIANTIITIHVYGTVKPVSSGHGILATTDRWLVVLFRINNVTGTSNMTRRESIMLSIIWE